MKIVAAIHFLAAVLLVAAIALLWDSHDPAGSVVESVVWLLFAVLLATIGGGLWNRRPWARLVALFVHWPVFVASILLLAATIVFLLVVPATDIAVLHALAWVSLFVLPMTAIASGWTLWTLHRLVPS